LPDDLRGRLRTAIVKRCSGHNPGDSPDSAPDSPK
jgi:hypothetical protein